MDSLAAMQVFVRVVEMGGLSVAGRALGLALMGNGAAVLANLVPAVRATRIDPIKVLST